MIPDWLTLPAKAGSEPHRQSAMARQQILTKPPGALGQLENLAILLATLQERDDPVVDNVFITVFAADHGVVAEGVSAFPQVVTGEMVRNFSRGGAAINVLARQLGAHLEVVNVGTVNELEPLQGVIDARQGPGTANMVSADAMTNEQFAGALQAGDDAVNRAVEKGAQLFIGGEMGIGNTTAAAAVACALTGLGATKLAGPGTGLDSLGVKHKAAIIDNALAYHQIELTDPTEALRCVGGFELAALAGAYISAAQQGIPVVVDGFIASSAALAAIRINPSIAPWLLLSHSSAEPGHEAIVATIGQAPLIDLGLRLGEGSGAALVIPLLRSACALHNQMATFDEAQVSDKD